ncbi:hypothetical protein RIF29_14811 [Crotalaria pallida]|uniref:Uncharacterized protein n=1 Tax=Crotalaria pallida TaxID=3830 RepID=A0AAN9FIU0_CROPI
MFNVTLTMFFNTLSYPSSQTLSLGSRNTCKIRSCHVEAMPPSSVNLNANESGNFSHGKKLHASNLASGIKAKSFSPLLNHDPLLSKEVSSYERSYFVSSRSNKLEFLKLDSSSIVQNLRNKRLFLENYGASCIVMPCNVSHSWYEEDDLWFWKLEDNERLHLNIAHCFNPQILVPHYKDFVGSPLDKCHVMLEVAIVVASS